MLRITFFIFCISFIFASAEQNGAEKSKSWFDKTKTKIELLFGINHASFAKCDDNWQKRVCDGSIMCYATKCFYPDANISVIHRIFLENLIKSLKESHELSKQEEATQLSHIAEFGLPKDNKRHDFVFIDSNNMKCSYTLWQKDDKTLFFDISGCFKSERITRTLIQNNIGTIELYEHIAY